MAIHNDDVWWSHMYSQVNHWGHTYNYPLHAHLVTKKATQTNRYHQCDVLMRHTKYLSQIL